MAENTSIQKPQPGGLQALLESRKASIAAALPKHVSAERLIKIALVAVTKSPNLKKCNQQSILLSVMQAAELGLEPGGALGGAYLVPYKDTCQLIVGYRGLIDLARRSGQIVSIEAHAVHAKDKFECVFGLESKLVHEPAWGEVDRGPLRFVYAVAKLKDGGIQFEVMSKAEVDAIRNRSRAKDSGPWVTDPIEMSKKTVVRRLAKYLPLSSELADALDKNDEAEFGKGGIDLGDMSPPPEPEEEKPASEQVVEVKAEEPKQERTKLENMLSLIAQSKDDAQLQQLTGAIKALSDDEQKVAKEAYALRKQELRKGEVRA